MMEEKNTREKLINAAYDEIYEKGYQGAALADILSKAGVHKGSMYHFFANKKDMALAAIKEKISHRFKVRYGDVISGDAPHLPSFFAMLRDLGLRDFKRGCPIANIVQEMSNIDCDFSDTMRVIYSQFKEALKDILDKAVKSGELKSCDTDRLALFVSVVIEGAILAAKASGDVEDYVKPIEDLIVYIQSYKGEYVETR